jgi:hypothetical protein
MQRVNLLGLGALLAGSLLACGDKNVSAVDPGVGVAGSAGAAGSGAGAGGGINCAGSAGSGATTGGIKLNESSCEAGKYIFLTTLDNRLVRFDPTTLALTSIGDLTCKAEAGAVPVAFAVDKQSIAWINYSDGTLHKLDMASMVCEKTAYKPYQQGWQKFSMAFNNDPSDPTGESILVADLTIDTSAKGDNDVNGLGKISPGDLQLKLIGDFDGPFKKQRAFITGRRDGRVFAYFLDADLPRRYVSEIDPSTAKVLSQTPVPTTLPRYGSFAHWGGSYYQFYSSDRYTNSAISIYTPGKGVKTIVKDAGLILYGASVSTCAPTQADIK